MRATLTRITLAAALVAGISTTAFAHDEANPELQSYDLLRHAIEAKGTGPSGGGVAILDSNPETASYTSLRAAQTLPTGRATGVSGPVREDTMRYHDGAGTN